jgi:hypothetical protein
MAILLTLNLMTYSFLIYIYIYIENSEINVMKSKVFIFLPCNFFVT